jgi:hypothetical protein
MEPNAKLISSNGYEKSKRRQQKWHCCQAVMQFTFRLLLKIN